MNGFTRLSSFFILALAAAATGCAAESASPDAEATSSEQALFEGSAEVQKLVGRYRSDIGASLELKADGTFSYDAQIFCIQGGADITAPCPPGEADRGLWFVSRRRVDVMCIQAPCPAGVEIRVTLYGATGVRRYKASSTFSGEITSPVTLVGKAPTTGTFVKDEIIVPPPVCADGNPC
jgi:hypothetical protein